MLSFCGQDKAVVDANGRLKFSPRVIEDFENHGGLTVVLHCLPERAIAVYPEDTYVKMRAGEPRPEEKAAASLVFRRTMRRFGAFTANETITAQGRVTIPPAYRDFAGIKPGSDVVIVGCEIGVEIWDAAAWKEELERVNEHVLEKGEREMSADLLGGQDAKSF